jgi:hypothetical protein
MRMGVWRTCCGVHRLLMCVAETSRLRCCERKMGAARRLGAGGREAMRGHAEAAREAVAAAASQPSLLRISEAHCLIVDMSDIALCASLSNRAASSTTCRPLIRRSRSK